MESVRVTIFAAIAVLLSMLATATAVEAAILEPPRNVSAGLGQNPVTISCTIRGDNIFLLINGTLIDHLNYAEYDSLGITVHGSSGNSTSSMLTQNVTFKVSVDVNNTNITCIGSAEGSDNAESYIAIITIAGPPLSPVLQYSVIDRSNLQVHWEEPFTIADFPVEMYFLKIVDTNETREMLLTETELSASDLSFSITQPVNISSCTNLTFELSAQNSVGSSTPSVVYGSFPFGPGDFTDVPVSEVTFSQNHSPSPILQINFTFPSLCPYNDANYTVVIENDEGFVYSVGPTIQHWMDGSALVSMDMRDIGLLRDTHYTANITVWNLAGSTSSTLTFNTTYLQITTQPSESTTESSIPQVPSTEYIVWIAAGCGGTLLFILILGAFLFCAVYIYKRNVRRRRECINTIEMARSAASNGTSMVNNPIYETDGAIYEEIPGPRLTRTQAQLLEKEEGYVSISPSASADRNDPTASVKDTHTERGQEDVYTQMKSAGTLLCHLNGGATAVGSSAESTPSHYSNMGPGRGGASAQWGWQQPQAQVPSNDPDTDSRYIIIN